MNFLISGGIKYCQSVEDLIRVPVKCSVGNSSVASPICQEGQSERTFPIFPLFPDFPIFFPLFPDFLPLFGIFFRCQGGTLPPLTLLVGNREFAIYTLYATATQVAKEYNRNVEQFVMDFTLPWRT